MEDRDNYRYDPRTGQNPVPREDQVEDEDLQEALKVLADSDLPLQPYAELLLEGLEFENSES